MGGGTGREVAVRMPQALWRGVVALNGVLQTVAGLAGLAGVALSLRLGSLIAGMATAFGCLLFVVLAGLWWSLDAHAELERRYALLNAKDPFDPKVVPSDWAEGHITYGRGQWNGRVMRVRLINDSPVRAPLRAVVAVLDSGGGTIREVPAQTRVAPDGWIEIPGDGGSADLDVIFVHESTPKGTPQRFTDGHLLARLISARPTPGTALETYDHGGLGPRVGAPLRVSVTVEHRDQPEARRRFDFDLRVTDDGQGVLDVALVPVP